MRLPAGETLGETLTIPWPHEANRLTLVSLGAPLDFTRTDKGLVVKIPEILRGHNPIAPVIRIEK